MNTIGQRTRNIFSCMKRSYSWVSSLLIAACLIVFVGPVEIPASTCIPAPSGLVSWWPGDGNAHDYAYVHDGYLMNGTSFSPGIVDQAFKFEPEGWAASNADNIFIPVTASIDDLQDLTIEAWVRLDAEGGLSAKIERFVTLAPGGIEKAVLRHGGGGTLHFYMRIGDESTPFSSVSKDNALQAGVFQHVAGTYDGSTMRLYLDGLEVASLAVSGPVVQGNGVATFSSPEEPIDGLVDEVTIYNRALAPAEILAVKSTPKCRPSPYTFGGFLPPLGSIGTPVFEIGSQIPVKFQLTDSEGGAVSDAGAYLGVHKPTGELVSVGKFDYLSGDDLYHYLLDTISLDPGYYDLKVYLDDGGRYVARVAIGIWSQFLPIIQ